MGSVNNFSFAQVPPPKIQRSTFKRDHGHKTTFNEGDLIPIFVDEVVPGDTFSCKQTAFIRLATPLKYPIMDNLWFETWTFFVPLRILWENFKAFMGESPTPGVIEDFVMPWVTSPDNVGFSEGSLFDYMGIPINVPGVKVNAMYARAYNKIFNEWFRSQDLVGMSQDNYASDGPDTYDQFPIRKRSKRHDYITACLLWPQKGDAVSLPITGTAPVVGTGFGLGLVDNDADEFYYGLGIPEYLSGTIAGGSGFGTGLGSPFVAGGANESIENKVLGVPTLDMVEGMPAYTGLEARLDRISAVTVNQLRESIQLQRLREKEARGGTRYTEWVRSMFGVTTEDARQQRPEFLGASRCRINVNPVQATSQTGSIAGRDMRLGDLGAFATGLDQNGRWNKSFTEHGIVMTIANVRADITYQQNLHRKFTRSTKWDFYIPVLAHLGEQAVLNQEVCCNGPAYDNDFDHKVFGYIPRYDEMRYGQSIVTGLFRGQSSAPLDAWHLAELFEEPPVLDETFISTPPPVDRVVAVQNEHHFIADMFFELTCARPMPTFSVPGEMDHF